MSRMISDSGPVIEQDFLELKPGVEVSYELRRFASGLAWLAAREVPGAGSFSGNRPTPSESHHSRT